MSESFERAMTVRRAVLGDEYVDRVMAKDTPLNAPFQQFVTRWAWGEAWLDDTLDPQLRSLLTIALVASLGQVGEVRLHTAGALRNGCQPEQIGAVLKHVAVYAGVALAVAALNAADEEIVAFTAANGSR
jgi:alkylhydroperoxidase/carboxymuconolactone decarboxylase family protein YurZ